MWFQELGVQFKPLKDTKSELRKTEKNTVQGQSELLVNKHTYYHNGFNSF